MCILSIIIIIKFNVIILIIIILILIIIILLQTNISKVNTDIRQPHEICSIEHTWLFCLFSGYLPIFPDRSDRRRLVTKNISCLFAYF